MLVYLGPIKVYFVNQPEMLRSLPVTSSGDYGKGVHFEQAKLVIGNSNAVHARVAGLGGLVTNVITLPTRRPGDPFVTQIPRC